MLLFEVQLGEVARGPATRSVGDRVRATLAERVTAYVLKFSARVVASHAMKVLERNVRRGIVVISGGLQEGEPPPALFDPGRWRLLNDLSDLTLPEGRPPRVLLLVHGTFSSTVGSYGALCLTEWGRALLREAANAYDLVLGFDHPTLSVDPLENAVELDRLLGAAQWKEPPVFEAVGFSRGGLVLRSFIETMAAAGARPFRFEKAVFVGATNGGTRLAAPDNWKALIDLYTNLVGGASRLLGLVAPGTAGVAAVVAGLMQGVGSFAKYLAVEAVGKGGIPGLAAMEPGGPFVTTLNRTQEGQPAPEQVAYYAVTSDFEHSRGGGSQGHLPQRLLLAVADGVIDRLMGASNDLVVDTPSMTAIDTATPGFVREVCELGTNPHVYHTVYFAQPEVCEALRRWLSLSPARGGKRKRSGAKPPPSWGTLKATYRVPSTPKAQPSRAQPCLEVEVVWGDVHHVQADVYSVGHYQGVLPQRAESALDETISFTAAEREAGEKPPERLVLTQLTRRGGLVGALGDVDLFPMAGAPGQFVAVCGMGHPGAFDELALRLLYRNLVGTLDQFPDERTLCTVLIGSGEGTLTTEAAVRGMLAGYADALHSSEGPHRIKKVSVVELLRHKAEEIQDAIGTAAEESGLDVRLAVGVIDGKGGAYSDTHRLALVLAAAARACQEEKEVDLQALDHLLTLVPNEHALGTTVKEALSKLAEGGGGDLARVARTINLRVGDKPPPGGAFPTRISFVRDGSVVRAAAITDTATVPERVIDVDPSLIAEAVRRMSDPDPDALGDHSDMLFRLVVPQDFRALLLSGGPVVFEVDRHTAAIHWEMLATAADDSKNRSVGLSRLVSRQLRTAYSAPPSVGRPPRGRLRALVIGDPGDPAKGDALHFARIEAVRVYELLKGRGVEVELLLGAPGARDVEAPPGSKPANRFDALERLIRGRFDIVHYAGHGDYDAEDPSRTGWLFSDGLLRAAEIKRIEAPPMLVFANACLSGRLSESDAQGRDVRSRPYGEAGLLPSLADEFFRRGVRNYVGTAWEVDDRGAVAFAEQFYRSFIPSNGAASAGSIGQALLDARRASEAQKQDDRCLWGAYQHYGDPNARVNEM